MLERAGAGLTLRGRTGEGPAADNLWLLRREFGACALWDCKPPAADELELPPVGWSLDAAAAEDKASGVPRLELLRELTRRGVPEPADAVRFPAAEGGVPVCMAGTPRVRTAVRPKAKLSCWQLRPFVAGR